MNISAVGQDYKQLNEILKSTQEKEIQIQGVLGQRYLGSGAHGKIITIEGTPGNAIGAYLNGCSIEVFGNVQDAAGDTMNSGKIIVHGNAGDTTGYAMRGGTILIEGNAGYRVGIHMKEYQEHKPVIVVGKQAGDFLGEYQAGGVIVVLDSENTQQPVGNYVGTGMHGGVIYIRCDRKPSNLPAQVSCEKLKDNCELEEYIDLFCHYFSNTPAEFLNKTFYKLTPNSKNPYKQLYTLN